jgi:hypothetical protein
MPDLRGKRNEKRESGLHTWRRFEPTPSALKTRDAPYAAKIIIQQGYGDVNRLFLAPA